MLNSPDKRREQIRTLSNIDQVRLESVFVLGDLATRTEDPRFSGPYARVADGLVATFQAKAHASQNAGYIELAKAGVTQHGFNVLAKILSYAPEAYLSYTRDNGLSPDIEELSNILSWSSDVLDTFARTDVKRNHVLEINFGLLGQDTLRTQPFEIRLDDRLLPHYTPNRELLVRSSLELQYREKIGDLPSEGSSKCPALGRVLKNQWNQAIEICVKDETLFQRDLINDYEPSL